LLGGDSFGPVGSRHCPAFVLIPPLFLVTPPSQFPASFQVSKSLFFNTLQFHSNANNKVIDNQCTFVLISLVYPNSNPCLALLHHFPVSHFHFLFSPNSFPRTSLAAPHPLTSIESHPYKKHRGGVSFLFYPSLFCSLLSLFASRVFHNSFAIKRIHTLSKKCRGVTPSNNSHSGTQRDWPHAVGGDSSIAPIPSSSFSQPANAQTFQAPNNLLVC